MRCAVQGFPTRAASYRAAGTAIVGSQRWGSSMMGLHPFGKISPWLGYISNEIDCRESPELYAGRSKRGIFARRDLSYDRQVMHFPALTYYVGDEDLRDKVKGTLRWVIEKMGQEISLPEDDRKFTKYVQTRLLNLQVGGRVIFRKQEEVSRFLADIPNGAKLVRDGHITEADVHQLAMAIHLNRFDMEYEGRSGIAVCPEASLFNHSCEPNVALTFHMNLNKEYVVEARVLKPISKGEQLFISYMPDNDLPLTRLATAMRKRWSFECQCALCRSRLLAASFFLCVFFLMPVVIPIFLYATGRQAKRARDAGLL